MNYRIQGTATSKNKGTILVNKSKIEFGTTSQSESLPNPAKLFLSSLAACILKNVERFSGLMKLDYEKTEIDMSAIRLNKPPRLNEVHYHLKIFTKEEHLNGVLLKRNIEKFGTIYNTAKAACNIVGEIEIIINNE